MCLFFRLKEKQIAISTPISQPVPTINYPFCHPLFLSLHEDSCKPPPPPPPTSPPTPTTAAARSSHPLMAESYALEMDDLHRRWLPKEILDDIGFADDGDAPPPPAAIEGLAVHLAGILGSGARKAAAPPPTAAASPASYHNQLHRVPVSVRARARCCFVFLLAWFLVPRSSPDSWLVWFACRFAGRCSWRTAARRGGHSRRTRRRRSGR